MEPIDKQVLPYSTAPKSTPKYVSPRKMLLEQFHQNQVTVTGAATLEAFKAPWRGMLYDLVVGSSAAGYFYLEVGSRDRFRMVIYLSASDSKHIHLPAGFIINEGDKLTFYYSGAATVSYQLLGVVGEKAGE